MWTILGLACEIGSETCGECRRAAIYVAIFREIMEWCIFLLNLGSRSPEIENVFGFCFWVGDVWLSVCCVTQTESINCYREIWINARQIPLVCLIRPCSLIKMSLQIGDEMLYYTKISINYSTQWIYFMNFMGLLPQPGSKPAWSVADFQHRLVLMTFNIWKMLCLGDNVVILVRKSTCISWANQNILIHISWHWPYI